MRVTLPSGTLAERALPADGQTARGLVLSPDIAGLRPLFDDLCQQLADEHGWAVIAPEPWPGQEDLSLEDRLESVGTLHDDRLVGDCVAAADRLGVEPVAVLGFCMGGMVALKAAASGRFDRAVSFYGMVRMPDGWRSDTMADALDGLLADPDHAPVLHLSGTIDPYVPDADIDALRRAGGEVVRYEGAHHGFVHDASRLTHRADDAADAWRRVGAFLSEPGG
jgi:carboxymethylenebutenolidase